MTRSCPEGWKADALDDGTLSAGDASSFDRHAKTCKECGERVRLDQHLCRLVQELPAVNPPDLPLRRLRARVLSDARANATRAPWGWGRAMTIAAGLVLVLVLALGWGLRLRGRPVIADPSAALVTAAPGTEWAETRHDGVETVRLTQGELGVVVRKQVPGERFVVATPDGELEVRGTTFDVVVDAHATRHVHVVEGRVAVRLLGQPNRELGPGESWDLDAPAAAASMASASSNSTATPPPAVASLPPARSAGSLGPTTTHGATTMSPSPDDGNLIDYEVAMRLYRAGQYADAAESFRRFTADHRDSSLAEDATFLEAVSLTNAGHIDAGAVAASRYLAEFTHPFHAKEAAVLVARAARDRGQCEEARRVLLPWLKKGADATAREALGACASP